VRQFITATLVFCSLLFSVSGWAQPMIVEKASNYLPNIPPLSFASMTSQSIEIKQNKKNRYEIVIPAKDIINLAITRNKNPVLSESIPGKYLHQFFVLTSTNDFEKTPVDAQVIIDGLAQSVKITGFNITPQGISLVAKPFSPGRQIKAGQGAGTVIVNSSCIKNRVACALGCTYVIVPEIECRKKLGIL
jgi:hypothetical protein